MNEFIEEYRMLVAQTKEHLQKKLPPRSPAPAPAIPLPISKPEKKKALVTEKVEIAQEIPPSPPPKAIRTEKVGSFTLDKESTAFTPIDLSSMKALLQQETLLFCLHEKDLPFLCKIADALHQHGLPAQAKVMQKKEELLIGQTLISEYCDEIASFFSLSQKIEYHRFIPLSSQKQILFLHPLALYESDIARKRDLWNSLKTILPQ